MGLFSTLALVLACVGIYGVLAFAVGQRAHEIAIRRAIGAKASRVATRVVSDGLRLVVIGLVLGGVGAAFGARSLEGFLFDIAPTDVVTFVSGGLAMVAVSLLASVVPAVRATSRHPAEVLASE
jgi:putative ABC transport system permease protein